MPVDRFNWWLPLSAVLAMFLALLIPDRDGSFMLYVLLGFPIVGLLAIDAIRKRRQRRWIVLMLAVYGVISAALLGHFFSVHTAARWLVWSHDYKAKVLAQPASADGELKHVEWDGWGFAGAGDTTVYLVFDPTDSLSVAARNHQRGKFNGIPCEVPGVDRVESQWYTVRFYTDEYWGRHNALNCGSKN
jgi:hypothetical protein